MTAHEDPAVELECQHWHLVKCGLTEARHWMAPTYPPHEFEPPTREPDAHERAAAVVVTTWVCPYCGVRQDVWGEGAAGTWMDCQNQECGRHAWLDLDLGIKEARGE